MSSNYSENFIVQALNRFENQRLAEAEDAVHQTAVVDDELLKVSSQQEQEQTASITAVAQAAAAAAAAVGHAEIDQHTNNIHNHTDEQSVAAAAVQSLDNISDNRVVDLMGQSNSVVDSVVEAAAAVARMANSAPSGNISSERATNNTNATIVNGNHNVLPEGLKPRATQNTGKNSTQTNNTAQRAPRVNRPGQKFGAKRRSWVWEWFIQDSTDYNLATCEVCGKCVMRLGSDKGSPKKLAEHLRTHKIDRTGHSSHIQQTEQQQAPQRSTETELYQGQVSNDTTTSNDTGINSIESHQSSFSVTSPRIPREQNSKLKQIRKPRQSKKKSTSTSALQAHEAITQSETQSKQSSLPTSYNSIRFQKHILQFVLENKLTLSTIKTESFKNLIWGLNPSAVQDLEELNSLYSPLVDVLSGRVEEDQPEKQQQAQTKEDPATDIEEEEGLLTEKDLDPELIAQSQTQSDKTTVDPNISHEISSDIPEIIGQITADDMPNNSEDGQDLDVNMVEQEEAVVDAERIMQDLNTTGWV